MNILQINSSARSTGSESTRLADAIVAKVSAANPGAQVTRRDLAAQPHPILDEAALGALFTPADARTDAQKARVALDDAMTRHPAAGAVRVEHPMRNVELRRAVGQMRFDRACHVLAVFRMDALKPRVGCAAHVVGFASDESSLR